MGFPRLKQSLLLGLCVFFLAAGVASAAKKVTVVGSIECLDCAEKNIKASHAFKGLRVAIKCKSSIGEYETKGVSQLDKSGNFHVNLPTDLLREESSTLKPECLAELRDKSNIACPKPDPLTLTLASQEKDQHTFTIGEDGKMHLISSICSSATFWPPYKWDPFHKFSFPWKKPLPKYSFPPKTYTPVYKPTPTPVYNPTPTPAYKPTPTPVYNPTPTPVYKPTPTPVYNPTPTPVYKRTPTPVYKPTPTPVYKPTPTPVPYYKPPLYKIPPLYKHPKFGFPPIYKPPFFKKKHPWFPPTEIKN